MTAKEEELDQKFTEILEILNEGVEEPAGSGCGFGFRIETQEEAYAIFKEIINQYTLSIVEKVVGDEKKPHESHTIHESNRTAIVTADNILTRIKNEIDTTDYTKEASEVLCEVYFEIASEIIGENKVRQIRDKKLKERVRNV